MEEDKIYVHVAVANSYDGREGFKAGKEAEDNLQNYPYMGLLLHSKEVSQNPEDYAWTLSNYSLLTQEEFKEAWDALGCIGHPGDPVGDPGPEGGSR